MKKIIKYFLSKTWYIKNLNNKINQQGFFDAGHYHSPIPDKNSIKELTINKRQISLSLQDIKINKKNQKAILNDYIQFYDSIPFPIDKNEKFRYYFNNDYFSYSDAIFLHSFLLYNKPKRIIEVGSGFSSAVILDTVEMFLSNKPEIIFIEPNLDRLNNLIFKRDEDNCKIINSVLQDTPLEIFSKLKSGDLLFIDSSHVVKYGSDLQMLFFNIMPILSKGVFVHFHDIFYPFEYPYEWLKKGIFCLHNFSNIETTFFFELDKSSIIIGW